MDPSQKSALILSSIIAAQDSLTLAWKTRNNAEIDISVNKWEALVHQVPPSYKRYNDVLASYAVALLLRWRQRHRGEDLDAAINVLERALAMSGKDDPNLGQYECYANLGSAYMDRWETVPRQASDLVNAINRWESAQALACHLDRSVESAIAILPHLGDAYCFAHSKGLLDYPVIQRAIECFKTGISYAPPNGYGSLNYRIGKSYSALYLERNDAEDLKAATYYLRQATSGTLSDEEMEDAAIELSDIFMKHYEKNRDKESLETAIYWARRAVHVKYQDGDSRILRRLGSLLALLYKDFQDQAALEDAILCYEQVWDLHNRQTEEDVATYYYNFATALMRRITIPTTENKRRIQDLGRAVELLTLAIASANAEKEEDTLAYKVQLKTAKERMSEESHLNRFGPPENGSPMMALTHNFHPLRSPTVPFPQGPFPVSSFATATYDPAISDAERSDLISPSRQFSVPSQLSTIRDPAWRSDTPEIQVWASYPVEADPLPMQPNADMITPPREDQCADHPLDIPSHTPPISSRRNSIYIPEPSPRREEETILPPYASIKPTNLTGRVTKTGEYPLAEGGFSVIYTGNFGKTKVAIKIIKKLNGIDTDTLKRRLRREMEVWWKLDHPNIVPLWGYAGDMDSLPSMIAPWYENGNASSYVQKAGLGVELRLQLLREVASGLRYLHQQSPVIVHGDLKPGNVLIDNDGVARLCDFGLAHLVATESDNSATPTGNVGTIRYAAPELRSPANDDDVVRATTSTDIYSLACIGYEFLYKKQPFAGKVSIQSIIAAGYSHIPPARRVMEDASLLGPTTPHYWNLFDACWDETPSKRPDIVVFCEQVDIAVQAIAFAN